MKSKILKPISLVLVFLFLINNPAFARVIICESIDGRYNYCPVKNSGDVRIINRLSSAECIRGRTWGYDRGGIWVDGGCRAEFKVGYDDYDYSWGGSDFIICESKNYQYQYCPANTRRGVSIARQLSNESCVHGRTWGYDRNGIWVDEGCRAEFRLNSGGRRDYDYDSDRRGKKEDSSSDELAAAIAIIGGLALLGALLSGDKSAEEPPDRYYEPPRESTIPYWLIGTFRGYSVYFNTEIQINISPSGIVDGYILENRISGYYNRGELILDGNTYLLEYVSDGFIARQKGNYNNQIYFRKIR